MVVGEGGRSSGVLLYNHSNHLPILLRLRSIAKLTFWVAAILDYKMATTKIVNQSILFPTAKNVDIATKIEFLYCFASEILSKQLFDGVHFAIQDGGPKSVSVQMETLVFGFREVSAFQKCIWLQLSTKVERKYIATLTISFTNQSELAHYLYISSILTLCLPKTEISVFQRPTLACQRRRFPSL